MKSMCVEIIFNIKLQLPKQDKQLLKYHSAQFLETKITQPKSGNKYLLRLVSMEAIVIIIQPCLRINSQLGNSFIHQVQIKYIKLTNKNAAIRNQKDIKNKYERHKIEAFLILEIRNGLSEYVSYGGIWFLLKKPHTSKNKHPLKCISLAF